MKRSVTLLLFTCALTIVVSAAVSDPVRVDSGMGSGVTGKDPNVRVYKHIPYAAPPVMIRNWRM